MQRCLKDNSSVAAFILGQFCTMDTMDTIGERWIQWCTMEYIGLGHLVFEETKLNAGLKRKIFPLIYGSPSVTYGIDLTNKILVIA